MRYEVLLAGVEEPEQASPAPPTNRTCTHNAAASSQVADGTSVEACQGRFDRDVRVEDAEAWVVIVRVGNRASQVGAAGGGRVGGGSGLGEIGQRSISTPILIQGSSQEEHKVVGERQSLKGNCSRVAHYLPATSLSGWRPCHDSTTVSQRCEG
ncbi:MAG: hypothetical protein FRX49_01003 [Trebouxia sp. A1-2]|nr:MAG: hypothetical protein FRX49_01003 [Trebouxia sp. A1-2]